MHSAENKDKISASDKTTNSSVILTHNLKNNPLCRICFSSAKREQLLKPCKCKGTIKYVHRNCLEGWLETKKCDMCELCQYRFNTQRIPKSFWEFCREKSDDCISVLMIGIFLMIFISITLWACYISVHRVLKSETSKSAAGKKKSSIVCFLIDSVFSLLFLLILTMWFFWMIGLFITEWTKWRKHNWYLKVVDREIMAKFSLSEDSPDDSRRSPEDCSTPVSPAEKDITESPCVSHCVNIEHIPTV